MFAKYDPHTRGMMVLAFSVVGCSSTTATDTNAPAPVAEANTPAEAK